MKEFKKSVATLIDTFTAGLAAIRSVRLRRKLRKTSSPPASVTTAESQLSKTLKRSLQDVRDVYARDRKRFGPHFAAGDEPARHSMKNILERLISALMKVREKLARGRCTRDDYKALAKLSNDSRAEAISTLYGLSARLSQSSIVSSGRLRQIESSRDNLLPRRDSGYEGARMTGGHYSVEKMHPRGHGRIPQAVAPPTPLKAPANPPERPAGSKRRSSERVTSTESLPRPSNSKTGMKSEAINRKPHHAEKLQKPFTPPQLAPERVANNRFSIYSFASDSTKLGEIPEKKWATLARGATGSRADLAATAFPLARWQDSEREPGPVKRSRFMRFLGR